MKYTKNNIHIYISTFGQSVINVPCSTPLEVGADNRDNFRYPLRDNTGENISKENPCYGELSGLFWIWKNVKFQDDDIIGFCHYNKALSISTRKILSQFNNRGGNIWITLKPDNIRNHDDVEVTESLLNILKRDYPKYYDEWFNHYDSMWMGKDCRGGNMFITSFSQFNKYCAELFDICRKMNNDLKNHQFQDTNMQRYCAFVGERFLAVFIGANKCSAYGCDIRYKPYYLGPVRKLIKKAHINKNNHIYKLLKERFGYKSSYKRDE